MNTAAKPDRPEKLDKARRSRRIQVGLYLVCLHHLPLDQALALARSWGIRHAEVAAGGFVPTPHCRTRELIEDHNAREAWQKAFAANGITLSALNANGNPLHPDPDVGPKHAGDVMDTVELASLLGVERVVVMAGAPGSGPDAKMPTWTVAPWDSGFLDVLEWQWEERALPFWTAAARFARDRNVRLCIEMHPHTVVYNPATLMRLADRTGAPNIGANLDPSHLFWQGIDPILATAELAGRVWHAAAKDTRLNKEAIARSGVLDDRFRRVRDAQAAYPLGGRYAMTAPPHDPPWQFVSPGRGHNAAWWSEFLAALERPGSDVVSVSIEHEDAELPLETAVPFAVKTLRRSRRLMDAAAKAS